MDDYNRIEPVATYPNPEPVVKGSARDQDTGGGGGKPAPTRSLGIVAGRDETGSRTLSPTHRRMLYEASAIDPAVAAERGYRTARIGGDVPGIFKGYQRRPGLVVPMYSPDGETRMYQVRPDRPRRGGPKYETPTGAALVVDVHPRMREEARHGDGDLWITEGAKTGDANTSRGLCTAVLAGVWGWCEPGIKPYRLRPCFDHIRLDGRRAIIAYDSDVMVKPDVQRAMAALADALRARGADVWAVYLPDGSDGAKQGLDDYYAAGGTVAGLRALAEPFDSGRIETVRMERNGDLAAAVDAAWDHWLYNDWRRFVGAADRPHWKRGHTARDVKKAMIKIAAREGRVTARGLYITKDVRAIAAEAAKGNPATMRGLDHLSAAGEIEVHESPGGRIPRSYTLLLPAADGGRAHRYHKGRGNAEGAKATETLQSGNRYGNGLRAPYPVPPGRWSVPGRKARRGLTPDTRRVRDNIQPAAPGQRRLEPHLIAAVDWAYAAGGGMPDEEMAAALHVRRVRDYRRRMKPKLVEAGVFRNDDAESGLCAEWPDALEREREIGGENEAAHRQRARNERERAANRERLRRRREPRRAENPATPPHPAPAPPPDGVIGELSRLPVGETSAAPPRSAPATPAQATVPVEGRDGPPPMPPWAALLRDLMARYPYRASHKVSPRERAGYASGTLRAYWPDDDPAPPPTPDEVAPVLAAIRAGGVAA